MNNSEKPMFFSSQCALHCFYVSSDGFLYGFGNNSSNQLGLHLKLLPKEKADCGKIYSPLKITFFNGKRIFDIAIGSKFTVFQMDSERGPIYVVGNNSDGQLGLNDLEDRISPTLLKFPSEVKGVINIACGYSRVHYVTTDNEVFAAGRNIWGQLGAGDKLARTKLTKIVVPNEKIVCVKNGSGHTILLSLKNRIFTCGRNTYGEMGDVGLESLVPVEIRFYRNININHFVCSENATYVLDDNNDLYSLGEGYAGELGVGEMTCTKTPLKVHGKYASVKCGGNHVVAKNLNGEYFRWGYGGNGRLSNGCTTRILAPKKFKFENLPVKSKDVMDFFLGSLSTYFVTKESIYGCGHGNSGQLMFEMNEEYHLNDRSNFILMKNVRLRRKGGDKKIVLFRRNIKENNKYLDTRIMTGSKYMTYM